MAKPLEKNEVKVLELARKISAAETNIKMILPQRGRFRDGCTEMLNAARDWFKAARDQDDRDVRREWAEYGLAALASRELLLAEGLQDAKERKTRKGQIKRELIADGEGVGTETESAELVLAT